MITPLQAETCAGWANLPTPLGGFRVRAFPGLPHLAVVRGDVEGGEGVLTRLHSECLTGDVFGSLRCDCRAQLQLALRRIAREDRGIVLYLRQEGRGIGLFNKICAYELQDRGLDTVEANRALGLADDARTYDVAAEMLATLGVCSVRLLTNNPAKAQALTQHGVAIVRRVALRTPPTPENAFYLQTKQQRMGHLLNLPDEGTAHPLPG